MRRRGVRVIAVALLGGMCLLYVWMQIDRVLIGYEIARLERVKAELKQKHEALQFQYAQLVSPERIAKVASERLGLRTPKPGEVILVTFETEESATDDAPIQLAQRNGDSP